MKKVVGVVLIIFGFILLLSKLSPIKEFFGNFIPDISQNYLFVGGGFLVIVGLLMVRGKKKLKEDLVPIFEGKKIVGYKKKGKK